MAHRPDCVNATHPERPTETNSTVLISPPTLLPEELGSFQTSLSADGHDQSTQNIKHKLKSHENGVRVCVCGATCSNRDKWKNHKRNQNAQQRKRQKISNSSINNQPSTVKELSSSPPNTITKDAESITCPTANPVSPSNEIPHVESSWTQLYQFLEEAPEIPPEEDESDSDTESLPGSASESELDIKDIVHIDYPIHDSNPQFPLFPKPLRLDPRARFQDFVTIIPETAAHQRLIHPKWIHVQQSKYDTRFLHVNESVVVMVFRNIFGPQFTDINNVLTQTTKELFEAQPATKKKKTKRKESAGRCYHFGTWRKYTKEPKITEESLSHPYFQTWKSKNAAVFSKIDSLFQQHFPLVHSWYQARAKHLPMPFHSFATCVVNVDFACGKHKDRSDCRFGYCFVLPFGTFTGGALMMEDIRVKIDLAAGDLLVFPSQKLFHWVEQYHGWRSSLVFLSHDSIFFPPK